MSQHYFKNPHPYKIYYSKKSRYRRICTLALVMILFHLPVVWGQKYGNTWYFGKNAGIDFNSCVPVALTNGNMESLEGCSTISDANGQLLFYTNSEYVWTRQNIKMPNGFLTCCSSTLSQVIIIPKPNSESIYYIITTSIQGRDSLKYHVVDMSLNNGYGDVVSKNNILTSSRITEQIAATYHSNGEDIWLMGHEYLTNKFLAYLVTSSGITSSPVVSSIGPAHVACNSGFNARGEIKFSPDGRKLAFNGNGIGGAGNDNTNLLTLFDFDNNTGIVTNPINLPFSRGEYGLSFSPDNSKLYGATWKAFSFTQQDTNYLYQFDLSSGIATTIINSKKIIQSGGGYGDIKIGPDGRIYVVRPYKGYLDVINNPNLPGMACNYISNAFSLQGEISRYGLNNYIEYITYCNTKTGVAPIGKSEKAVTIFPNPFSTFATLKVPYTLTGASLKIYNALGKQVKEIQNISGQTIRLYRDDLPAGMYFIRVTEDNKIIATEKLIISDN